MSATSQNWQAIWEESIKHSNIYNIRSDLSEKDRLNLSADSWYRHYDSKQSQDDPQRKHMLDEEMNRLRRFITKDSSVLDIGAGFGRLAVPLAKEVRKLTAIEPAGAYRNAMVERATREGVGNMEFSEDLWADFPLHDKYDLVYSTWSGAVKDPASLMKMHEASRGYCALELGASSSKEEDFDKIYAMIMGEELRYPGNYLNIITTLYDHGIYANIETWEHDSMIKYQTIDDAVELRRNGLEAYTQVTDDMIEQLRQFFRTKMNPDGSYTLRVKRFLCMVWWTV